MTAAAIDLEFDVFYQLLDGFVWCDAGCSVIGEHNGHPCTHCGGKGFHRDTQTHGGESNLVPLRRDGTDAS